MIGRKKGVDWAAKGAWLQCKRCLVGRQEGVGWNADRDRLEKGRPFRRTESRGDRGKPEGRKGTEKARTGKRRRGLQGEERRILVREKEAFGKERGDLQ